MFAPRPHPVRLRVEDDLVRGRLTVFFRFLLVLPHFLWISLWSLVAWVVLALNWFATLAAGRSPRGLHDFLAGYLRYTTHVYAYVYLAAGGYPGFFLGSVDAYPVDVDIDPPEPQNRLKTLCRGILALPSLLLVAAFGASLVAVFLSRAGGVAGTASFLGWFASLARGRMPRGLRDLAAWGLGYRAQAMAYLYLLTDRYPYTGPDGHLALEPVDAEDRPSLSVTDDLRRSRLTVFFRLPLAAPHIVWQLAWGALALLAAALNWIAALAVGRSPAPLARFLAAYVRYAAHLNAFLFLVGNPFPGFVGKPGSYPVDLELDPFSAQRRVVTLFRLPLALPAVIVGSALSNLLFVVAVLGWFAALARGRMPEGLRNAGAYAIGYGGQVSAYLFVLTDRYPHASPSAVLTGAASSASPVD